LRGISLLKHVIERKTEKTVGVMGIRGKKRKQLLDDLEETRGYCELKEETPDLTLWRTVSGRGYGLVRQTIKRMT